MKSTSAISAQRVQLAKQARFNPLRGLTPELLASTLDDFRAGNLRRAALLWDAMANRDPILKSVIPKRLKAAGRCPWEILTTDDSPRALEHAAALRWFYDNLCVTNAYDPNERGGFALLVRQMLSAVGMKYALHEIILKPQRGKDRSVDLAAGSSTTLLTAELRFTPLWWFENRNGPLAFLKNDWDYAGDPLKPGEWLVTVGEGLMECCSVAYLFKSLSLQDWLAFNDKFGFPWIDAATDQAAGSEAWDALAQMVANFVNDGGMVRSLSGTQVNLVESKTPGGHVPFEPLVDRMDRYNATVWRGGDLSTMSGAKAGENTGASLQKEEGALLTEDDCQLVSEALNLQLDTLVLDYLFGETPLAYIKLQPPRQLNVAQDLNTARQLAAAGVPVGVDQLRERLGWPAPAAEEEKLTITSSPVTTPAASQPL